MTSTASGAGAAGFEKIAGLLVCPACKAGLSVSTTAIRCAACGTDYPVHEGIPLLAIRGTSETWGTPQGTTQSEAYQREYQQVERAAFYNQEYRRQLLKRSSTRREYQLIQRQIRRVGPSRIILDLPCGGGRLTPAFAASTELVIEADIAVGQVLYGRSESTGTTPRIWMTASAFHIPLRDDGVDGTVCVRLSHHMPTAAERERLLKELLRVSRRFLIMTFFDHHSLKNTLRRVTRPFNHKPPKMTMTTARVAELARESGARMVEAPALSHVGSGHRYALIVKDGVSV